MTETVAKGVSLQSGATERQMRSFDMSGGNAVELVAELVSYDTSPTTIRIYLDESNDEQNWAAVTGTYVLTLSADGTNPAATAVTGISARYVRMRASMTAGGTAVISATLNIADL